MKLASAAKGPVETSRHAVKKRPAAISHETSKAPRKESPSDLTAKPRSASEVEASREAATDASASAKGTPLAPAESSVAAWPEVVLAAKSRARGLKKLKHCRGMAEKQRGGSYRGMAANLDKSLDRVMLEQVEETVKRLATDPAAGPEAKQSKPTPNPVVVRKLVEYYLSDENLKLDKVFSEKIAANKDGWLDIDLILQRNEMKDMSATKENVKSSLIFVRFNKDSKIEISKDGAFVRRLGNAPVPKLESRLAKKKRERESRERQLEKCYSSGCSLPFQDRPITLGPSHFKSLAMLRDHVREIMNSCSEDEQLKPGSDFQLIKRLLDFHPRGVEKSQGLVGIKVAKSQRGNTRCFYIIKEDRQVEDFSYLKCLDAVRLNPP